MIYFRTFARFKENFTMTTIRKIQLITIVLIFFSITSCTSYKKLPYLKEAETLTESQIKSSAMIYEAKIMPNDVLSITVNSRTKGIAQDFNLELLPNNNEGVNIETYSTANGITGTLQNYIVDTDGNINFPVLGSVSVAGLTRIELQDKLANLICPKYISELPIINVRFLNFKVSVLGEVARPGMYSSENSVLSLFDALALAGDLTIYGKRSNVMLLRENEKGEVKIHRINLQDKDILLNKDIYYLQQNDKIIVEANKTRGNASSIGSLESIGISVVSIMITIVTLITR